MRATLPGCGGLRPSAGRVAAIRIATYGGTPTVGASRDMLAAQLTASTSKKTPRGKLHELPQGVGF
jgi:hypothetical protein